MQATEFEFRHRFWIITALYTAAFSCYRIDHVNVSWAIATAVAGHGGAAADFCTRLILGCGALAIAVGTLLRSWAAAYLHSWVVHDGKLHADRLVSDGPYRRVRNPLYLGMTMVGVGMGLAASRLGFAILAVGITLISCRLLWREEAMLMATQGESYRRYLARVPRLFPAWRARVPASGAKPNWLDGLLGEGLS
jgi:protein-S-isoprenylcysteine O-methyltransferase Ste14